MSFKLFQNLTSDFGEDFLRTSSCPYNASSPHSPRAMFIDRSKFRKQLLKKVTQGTFLRNYFKIRQAVSEEKVLKELLKIPFRCHGKQEFFMKSYSVKKILKRTSVEKIHHFL